MNYEYKKTETKTTTTKTTTTPESTTKETTVTEQESVECKFRFSIKFVIEWIGKGLNALLSLL